MASSSSNNSHATPAGEALVRPTEAMLRWSQFHFKRRAVNVRASIEALHQSPTTWEQVQGSLPEDENSGSSSNCSDVTLREIRSRRRPTISRGRRALLKVSRRSYQRRRELILEQGYQGMTLLLSGSGSDTEGSTQNENDIGPNHNKHTHRHHHHQQKGGGDDDGESDVHEDALNEIFMVQSSRQRRRRRKRRKNQNGGNPQKDESFKRFQAACHAMMMNLAAPPKLSIVIPTRKWTRTVDPAAALDDEYLDPKWGIRRRPDHQNGDSSHYPAAAGCNGASVPMDRGASWMMHLPKGQSTARENPYYHDPSLALPPSAGSFTGSDSRESSVASALALQAPGKNKFNMLVALVQQRMIRRHQEERKEHHVKNNDDADEGTAAQQYEDPGRSEFHTRQSMPEGLQSPYSPRHSLKKRAVRRAHYVPRMRLRDFVPEGTSAAEVEELERSLMDGKGIPPKMKLRGFPGAQQDASSPDRRKSRTLELAESFETSSKQQQDKDRRLSKTRQMAQSLEGNNQHSKHPTMRLRSNFEINNNGEEDEKKLSDDGGAATSTGGPPPRRHAHALSGPFSGPAGTEEGNEIFQGKSMSALSMRDDRMPQDNMMAAISEDDDSSGLLPDPPRRKPHPMSERFVQAMQASQQTPPKAQFTVRPLPPGTCCSRCAKPSPIASSSLNSFPFSGRESTGTEGRDSGNLFAQVRNINAKVSIGSARVSDFFSQLRQSNDGSVSEYANAENTEKRDSSATGATKSTTESHRASDFFSKVRQLNPKGEPSEAPQSPSTSTSQTEELPLEETDFFAQVREMIATTDDDEESAAQRVSDFFAQVRQMTNEMEEENIYQDDSCPLCEECQVEDIEEQIESASVNLSPDCQTVSTRSASTTTPARSASNDDNTAMGSSKTGSFDNDDATSEHSAISGLWNRGRTSLNSFASSLNAISEKTAIGIPNPTGQSRLSASSMPSRVGGFLQRLQGQKEQERQRAQLAEEEGGAERIAYSQKDVGDGNNTEHILTRRELQYDGENDLEAMAAYRKSQEFKRLSSHDGETSSHSSFHVLPDGIREVVKRSSPPKNPQHVATSPQRTLGDSDRRPPLSSPLTRTPMDPELDTDFAASALSRPSTESPGRMSLTSSAFDSLSPEKYRQAHEKIMQSSPLLGNMQQGIIDTDGTTSDVSNSGMDPQILASMMLSPDLLQKRLHQAVRAVEDRRWDQVEYLLNANPWLAEMCELTTNQYLLHKIAFFGLTAPRNLCEHLMERFPSAIYKFDHDGNVPLHLAAAAGHMKMIRMLGDMFESGASIRNEDGMLPLHFTIASYADYNGEYDNDDNFDEDNPNPLDVIKTVLKLFPKAVAIGDNDGNLPIHVAAECLSGDFGVDIIYVLLDEADRQLQDPYGVRFRTRPTVNTNVQTVPDSASAFLESALSSDGELDSTLDEDIHCIMVKNDFGETPMLSAVRHRRGWDVIEALVGGPGGRRAALYEDAGKNNLLHLLVGEYQDPAAAMSILKIVPRTATMRNSDGMLPIEVACLQLMPEEVILAMALVDLPFDIDDKDFIKLRDDHGGSWWFLVCECDDHYVDIVQQILMICTFQQVRELCFAKRGSSQQDTVLSRATPKCKVVLSHALRFLGRFEFLGDTPLEVDSASGIKVFDAIDFAEAEGTEEGRRVILKCYSIIDSFANATNIIRNIPLDPGHVEEIAIVGDNESGQYCLAIECPQLTLDRVVDGMTKKTGYQYDTELRKKYAAKMCAVLRLIAKAIKHLHTSGVIHGNLCMETCGKFDHTWKLLDIMQAQRAEEPMDPKRYQRSFPPEVLQLDEHEDAVYDSDNAAVSFRSSMATPSIDIWAFGKLAYETLVGKPLVDFDPSKESINDVVSVLELLEWDQSNMKVVFTDLLECGATDSCAELITSCLFPRPEDRPLSMDAILQDRFWKDMRQYRQRSPRSSFDSSPTKSIFTDTASAVDTSQEVDTTTNQYDLT